MQTTSVSQVSVGQVTPRHGALFWHPARLPHLRSLSISEPEFPLHFRSATSLAAAINKREISAAELLELFLARIDALNPKLNAVIWMAADRARARAKRADEALARGEVWGPLHGVPVTIKESFQ